MSFPTICTSIAEASSAAATRGCGRRCTPIGEQPQRRVVLLESGRCGEGASGRNGGFLASSLTHGIANGLSRFADEMPALERLAIENFTALREDLARFGIDAEYELPGGLTFVLAAHQLRAAGGGRAGAGSDTRPRCWTAVRSEPRSTRRSISAGSGPDTDPALVHPGKLAEVCARRAHSGPGRAGQDHQAPNWHPGAPDPSHAAPGSP